MAARSSSEPTPGPGPTQTAIAVPPRPAEFGASFTLGPDTAERVGVSTEDIATVMLVPAPVPLPPSSLASRRRPEKPPVVRARRLRCERGVRPEHAET